jgi:hypothetical protein
MSDWVEVKAISAEEYLAIAKEPKQLKYRNEKTTIDGITFASRAEARRYWSLKIMERAGEIEDLELQPRYPLVVNGVKVCVYVADFSYFDCLTQTKAVEDTKGVSTPVYKIKKNLMFAIHGITIRETR